MVGTGILTSGALVGRTVTVAVDVVVRDVVVVGGGGGGGDADDDGEAATVVAAGLVVEVEVEVEVVVVEEAEEEDGISGVIKLVGCTLSGVVICTTAAELVMLVSANGKLEVGKMIGDVDVGGTVTSAGAVELKGNDLLEVVAVEDGIDVELEAVSWVDTISVGAELVGTPAEVVVPATVAVVPGSVALEAGLSPPVEVWVALVVEGG
jgi:hypothetical protein